MNRSSQFPKTEWTKVVNVIGEKSSESFDALSKLCEDYWYPLYAFVRRQGASAEEALDEVQGFFEALLEKEFLEGVDRNRGRLRTFLIDALKKYRAKEYRAKRAIKRGGDQWHVSIDQETAEGRYEVELVDHLTPEQVLDRNWALTILEKVMAQLEQQYRSSGKETEFEVLRSFLVPDPLAKSYREIGAMLGTNENNVKAKVHRLRKRYRAMLEDVVRTTLDITVSKEGLKDELRHLLGAFS